MQNNLELNLAKEGAEKIRLEIKSFADGVLYDPAVSFIGTFIEILAKYKESLSNGE